MHTKKYTTCPVCDSKDFSVFFELLGMPVNVGIQWPTRQEAVQCPKGDVNLAFCRSCSFAWNLTFNPIRLDYSQDYENSLFFSPMFREYTKSLILRLINRYDLRNKNVIDIGCGKGDFLFLICELGKNRGIGFDTSYEKNDDKKRTPEGVTVIQDFYSEKYAEYKANLICSRFVFEHIEQPKVFLKMIRNAIGDRRQTIVYFEVPNISLILHDLSVWDIVYEHCSYFSISSLERVFTLCGFDILDLYESYERQFLGVEASLSDVQSRSRGRSMHSLQRIAKEVDSFVDNNRKKLESWQKNLEDFEVTGKRAVLWGAGAKGVSFLNMLKVRDQIQYVIDINPHKHGKYMPGTGQQIVPPEFLQNYKPDILILTNAIYKEEIQKTVNNLGISPEFLVPVFPK